MEYRYRNPWARPYEPQEYVRTIAPVEHNGCLIFHALPAQYDTVKNGVCIAQRCVMEGAKHAADLVSDIEKPSYEDVRARLYKEIEG